MRSRILALSVMALLVISTWGLSNTSVNAGGTDFGASQSEDHGSLSGLFLVFEQHGDVSGASARLMNDLQVAGVEEVHHYGEARLVTIQDASVLSPEMRAQLTPIQNSSVVAYRNWISPADIHALGEGEKGFYIVSFAGPVDNAWLARIKDAGLRIVDTAAPYSLVVKGRASAVEGLFSIKTTTGINAVRGVQPVPDDARLEPALLNVIQGTMASRDIRGLRYSQDGRMVVRVIAYEGENMSRINKLVSQYARPAIDQEGYGYPDAFVIEGPEAWTIIRNIAGVSYIEPQFDRRLMNNLAAKSSVLAIEDVWNSGYTGAGVSVNHNDSGVDTTHADFPSGVITATAGKMTGTDNGHGTHTAGSVVGRGLSGSTPTNNSGCGDLITGFSTVRGMAYGATLTSNNLFDPGSTGKTTEDSMMKFAQDSGSQLSTNSWGYTNSYSYGSQAVTIDRAVRDADTSESGQQALCILFAAGNDGSGAGTVGNPGTAKNAITVGASHNARCGSYPTPSSNFSTLINTVVDFSGRGPSQGRIKPDIVATGANVLSVGSHDSLADWGGWDQTWTGSNYALLPGTSMATPIVAGATAVFYQYYKATQGGAFPSPALAKAALINGAVAMSGYTYQNSSSGTYAQGWGRLNLKNTVQGPTGGSIFYREQQSSGMTTGQNSTFTFNVSSSSVPLKVTLTWTDPQGSSGSSAPLVNNLDLVLTAPNGTVYRGNSFSGVWSVANSSTTDNANNVENVFVQSPATGTWTLQVNATNVPTSVSGKTGQDFALVHSGAVSNLTVGGGGGGTVPTAPSGLGASATSSSQINISWTDNSSNETGFKIERKTGSGGTYAQIATVGAGVTNYANTGLTASTTYYYRVRATNATGDSGYSNEANATTSGSGGGGGVTDLSCGASVGGSLATTDGSSNVRGASYYADVFSFTPTNSGSATITLTSSAFDTYLYLKSSATATTALASDDDGNGGTNSKIVYTVTAGTTYYVEATSYSTNATGAYTIALTCPTGGGGGGGDLVANGGFESGTASWTFATYSSVTSGSAQAGSFKAEQLGRGTTTSTNFYQPISGFNSTTRTLRFYMKISSAEGTSRAYDYLRVRVKNTSGSTVKTLATYSNRNKNTYANWTLVTLSISSTYAKPNYRISFDANEDSSLATTYFVDGVSIQ